MGRKYSGAAAFLNRAAGLAFPFLVALWFQLEAASLAAADTGEALPAVSWARNFGDTEFLYRNEVVAFTPGSKELVIGGVKERYRGKIQKEGIWIWRITPSGEKVANISLKTVKIGRSTARMVKLHALCAANDGTLLAVAESHNGLTILLKLDLQGTVATARYLSRTTVRKILPLRNSGFLLIGSGSEAHSLLLKIDNSGAEVWRKEFDRGQPGVFSDGVTTADEGFVLVEESAKSPLTAKDIFVVKFDSRGEKQEEVQFPGTFGRIASAKNGSLAILYGENAAPPQEIWVQVYDRNFNSKGKSYVATASSAPFFNITAIHDGNYMISGIIPGSFNVITSFIDPSGTVKWESLSQLPRVGVEVACTELSCYLIDMRVSRGDGVEVAKMEIIKFDPK